MIKKQIVKIGPFIPSEFMTMQELKAYTEKNMICIDGKWRLKPNDTLIILDDYPSFINIKNKNLKK